MRALLTLAFFVLPSIASAQARTDKSRSGADYHAVQRMGFDDEEVAVGTLQPAGDTVGGITRAKHRSLIRIRADFRRELVGSALSAP